MDQAQILLTGGTGFFGRSLLRRWAGDASIGVTVPDVWILSRDPAAFLRHFSEFAHHEWLHFHHGDVLKPDSLPWSMSFTHVIHAATESAKGPQTPPLLLFQQIIDGAQNILELAVQTGASRILLTSSGAVYGPQPPEINALAEDYAGSPDLTSPASAYGMGKRAAEHLCHLYHHTYSLEPVIARCFAFIGQDLPLQAHYAIGNFLHNAIYGDYIRIEGDGAPLRTYMHQDDLAKWLIRLLENGKAGEAYNVGSDEVTTINDLAHLVRDMIAPEKAIRILGKQAQTITRNIYVPSIDKAQRTLGLKIELPLELAIRKTHESLRSTLAVLRS